MVLQQIQYYGKIGSKPPTLLAQKNKPSSTHKKVILQRGETELGFSRQKINCQDVIVQGYYIN